MAESDLAASTSVITMAEGDQVECEEVARATREAIPVCAVRRPVI